MSRRQATVKGKVQKKTLRNNDSSNAPRRGPRRRGRDRSLMAPVASQVVVRQREPRLQQNGKTLVVSHREITTSVVAPTGLTGSFFELYRLRINPGSAKTFPWLSKLAPLYESYRFRKLSFEFITRCPSTQTGSLVLSPDYDAADGDIIALTEQEVFSNIDSVEIPIWSKGQKLSLKTERLNRLYRAHTNMSDSRFSNTSQDQKTVDAAQVFVFTDSPASKDFSFGKLIVDYEVEFFNPQAPTDPVNQGGFDMEYNVVNSTTTPINGVIAAIAEDNPILDPNAVVGAVNSAVAGRFTRDWEGLLSLMARGTGFSGTQPTAYVSNDNNTTVGVNDVVASGDTLFNVLTSTGGFSTVNLKAKAGQYLKLLPPTTLSTLTNFQIQAGGNNLGNDLL